MIPFILKILKISVVGFEIFENFFEIFENLKFG